MEQTLDIGLYWQNYGLEFGELESVLPVLLPAPLPAPPALPLMFIMTKDFPEMPTVWPYPKVSTKKLTKKSMDKSMEKSAKKSMEKSMKKSAKKSMKKSMEKSMDACRQANAIKRPKNCFMIFAQQNRARHRVAKRSNAVVSTILGMEWHALGEAGRKPYLVAAAAEADRHKAKHPDYKFTRKRRQL